MFREWFLYAFIGLWLVLGVTSARAQVTRRSAPVRRPVSYYYGEHDPKDDSRD